MATSVLTCLIFIFFLPSCFSNSCTTTLPCDPSIQIKPPFYFQSDITMDPNCRSNLLIGCDNNNKPFLSLFFKLLPLESIAYDTSINRVQDPYLSSSLEESGCGNLYFNFSSPINDFSYDKYELLNTSLSSVRCYPPNQIQISPKIFGMDYNLSYSSFNEDDKHPHHCFRPDNSLGSFEYIFSFKNDSKQLSLISAVYSRNLVAQPDCFTNSTEVFDQEDGKKKIQARRITIFIDHQTRCQKL